MSTTPTPLHSYTSTWHTTPSPSIHPTIPALSQRNKTIVITGSGSGIGAAIAKAFALAGAANIALIGRTESKLQSTKESILHAAANDTSTLSTDKPPKLEILVVPADTSSLTSLTTAFETITSTFRAKIDVLVTNAGYLHPPTPIADLDGEEWSKSVKTNLEGTLFSVQAFLPHANRDDALIINISTALAHFPAIPGFGVYAATKLAAMKVLDYAVAENKEWLRLVHCQPGSVESESSKKSGMKTVDDVNLPAFFAVWLASPEARFLNRRFTYANWDVEELMAKKEEILKSPSDLTLGLYGITPPDLSRFAK